MLTGNATGVECGLMGLCSVYLLAGGSVSVLTKHIEYIMANRMACFFIFLTTFYCFLFRFVNKRFCNNVPLGVKRFGFSEKYDMMVYVKHQVD